MHEGIGCSEEHAAEVAHARYEEKKLDAAEVGCTHNACLDSPL